MTMLLNTVIKCNVKWKVFCHFYCIVCITLEWKSSCSFSLEATLEMQLCQVCWERGKIMFYYVRLYWNEQCIQSYLSHVQIFYVSPQTLSTVTSSPRWGSSTISSPSTGMCSDREAAKRLDLKSTYHGFLKMTIHVVWNIALREWKHPAKIYIWKCTVYKVIVFQKCLWNELFLKRVISCYIVT